jgi:hypothetical protein
MSTVNRISTWDRRTGYVLRIAAGKLTDAILGRALVDGDAFTMSAQAFTDDGAVTPTALAGASAVSFAWSATANQWAAELPYVAGSMDALATVRVVATLTANGTTHDLMDATVTFTRADGR